MHKVCSILLLALLIVACQSGEQKNNTAPTKGISKAEAMALATNFVITQGYTEAEADAKKATIVFEEQEFATDTSALLKSRHNMLLAKAFGARKYKEGTKWAVAFEYAEDVDNIGRCVTMDTLGKHIYMQTQDIRLDWILE